MYFLRIGCLFQFFSDVIFRDGSHWLLERLPIVRMNRQFKWTKKKKKTNRTIESGKSHLLHKYGLNSLHHYFDTERNDHADDILQMRLLLITLALCYVSETSLSQSSETLVCITWRNPGGPQTRFVVLLHTKKTTNVWLQIIMIILLYKTKKMFSL